MNVDEAKKRVIEAGYEEEDFDPYVLLTPEEKLRYLADEYNSAPDEGYRRFWEGRIIEHTLMNITEHPQWFHEMNIPCSCYECCSCR